MKCKRCNTDDWYVRGKYRRCRECHRQTMLRSYHNRKLGIGKVRKQQPARNFSQELAHLTSTSKRSQTTCIHGHALDDENTRIDIDAQGRKHRRCRKCERVKNYRKYGLEIPSEMRDLLASTINPWSELE